MTFQADRFLAAQQRALRAIEEAHAFLRFQVDQINAERVARGQPPLPEIKPLGG
jgi:hypothetical protein